jgi:DNA invertase Pin-like site-specific DNA recombinase
LHLITLEQIKLRKEKMTTQNRKFVAYYRLFAKVKTSNSLASQKQTVAKFLVENKAVLVADYTENETKFAKTRPALAEAIAVCKKKKAKLLIATLDKLSTDAAFTEVLLKDTKAEFVCADFPAATREMLVMRQVFQEWQNKRIGEKTKLALAKIKKEGKIKLGSPRPEIGSKAGNAVNSAKAQSFAERVAPTVKAILKKNRNAYTLREIGAVFTAEGLTTPRGNLEWSPTQVKHLLSRIK